MAAQQAPHLLLRSWWNSPLARGVWPVPPETLLLSRPLAPRAMETAQDAHASATKLCSLKWNLLGVQHLLSGFE